MRFFLCLSVIASECAAISRSILTMFKRFVRGEIASQPFAMTIRVGLCYTMFMQSMQTRDIVGHGYILNLLDKWLKEPNFAYLFHGPAHVGKSLIAERFVRALTGIETDRDLHLHPDIVLFEPEEGKKEVSVKQVREARSRLYARPQFAPRMVAFLPHLDRLNDEGFNALLKVMEEPPAAAAFVGVAENTSRIPATILSRMVPVPFKLVPQTEIIAALIERGLSSEAATVRAGIARGRPALALSEDDPLAAFRQCARKYVAGSRVGNRLAAADEISKLCESTEDSAASWNDALEACTDAVRDSMSEDCVKALILGQGIADAFGCIGGAVSPRLMLDAGALNVERNFVPMPNIYQKTFALSLTI